VQNFPSLHALYFYRSSWPFLRILLPSSLSVCLPTSLQLVTTAEPDRRLAALAYSLSALFSAKWKHRWRKKIGEKEDQNKILLMLGFFVVVVSLLITQLKSFSFSSLLHPSNPPPPLFPSIFQQLFDNESTLVFAQDCAKSNCILIPFCDHQRPGECSQGLLSFLCGPTEMSCAPF
jgi:hypothetical protein